MEGLLKLGALFLALFFGFMAFIKLYAIKKSREMQGKTFEGLSEGVVYFYSERCGACRAMKPEVEKLKERVKVIEVDVSKPEGYELARGLGVIATPTTLVIRHGVVRRVFVGLVRHSKILQELWALG